MSRFLRFTPALLLALTLFSAGTALAADATTATTSNQAATASNVPNRPCWNNAAAGTGRHMNRMGMHAAGFGGMHMAQGQHAGFGPHAMAAPTVPATR